MTGPRCSACNRIAIVEIDDNVFLCRRCEIIFRREFPNVARKLSDLARTPLPLSPFIIDPEARFQLDEDEFWRALFQSEPLPIFLTDPSDDFIASVQRDVLPIIEDAVRRAG